MPQLGDWGRTSNGEILWRGNLGQRPRYHIVKIPNNMWSSQLFCVQNGQIKPSGTQWIQVQYGWSYHERLRWTTHSQATNQGTVVTHIPVANIPSRMGDGQDGFPGLTNQYGHPAGDEVLNTAINPRTGQPEKNFTRLAVGQFCYIKEIRDGSATQLKDFFVMPTAVGGQAVVSKGWVAKIQPDGLPAFEQFNGG